MAIVKESMKVLSEDDSFVTYQMNTPIYDEKGYPTWEYDDSNPDIVTLVKHPLFNNK